MRRLAWLSVGICLLLLLSSAWDVDASPPEVQAVVTVTGTPRGPMIIVPDQVNVRLGPGTEYDKVGVLIAGQEASALGRSPGGDWIQIVYPGVPDNTAWVYASFVVLESTQMLPVVEIPPTPTPRVTATIDPTLAAQFNLGEAPPTRLPTFTPAAPVIQPTFEPEETLEPRGVPPILAILGLLVVGTFGMVISFLRGS